MIFVDTNVFMYAVGRPHPLQPEARAFFLQAVEARDLRLCTSAEVLPLPLTIDSGGKQGFTVRTERAAGQPPTETTAPYFNLRTRCSP